MKTLLLKSKFIFIIFFLFQIPENVNAQCSIIGSVNTSTLPCSSFTGCTSITIGNGGTATLLSFNQDLDLTCLGPIQLIITNNASVNFGSSDRLYLGAGSSIIVQAGGDLSGSSCNASERIYVGGVLLASCNGGGPGTDTTFADIEAFGGTGSATSNSPVCVGSSINLSATRPPNGGLLTYTWYEPAVSTSSSIGTGQNVSITSATAGSHIYQVKMYSVSLNKTMSVSTTVVVIGSSVAATLGSNGPICSGADAVFTITGAAGNTVTYTGAVSGTATIGVGGTVNVTVPGVTANTTLNITNVNNGTCNRSLTGTSTVTVRSLANNTGTGFSSTSFCVGNQATITFDANNGSGVFPYTLVYRNDTTNATASVTIANDDPTTFNIIPNPITTTDYTLVSITDSNGCIRTGAFGDNTATATINAIPSAPIVGTITQPTCNVPTGSVVLSGLPSGNWTINPGGIPGSTTSTIVSGLAGGAYNFTVTNASGCISASASVPITSLVTNTYTGTWSAGSAPPATGGTQNIVFNAGLTVTTDLSGCSCTVNSGNVIIDSDRTLIITNAVTVSGGSLTFENNSSLVQINNVTNTGSITYRRKTTEVGKFDYTYWSSPVSPQQLENMSPNTLDDKFFSRNAATNMWVPEDHLNFMTAGKGYIARGPQGHTSPMIYEAPFVGVPNNGDIPVPIVANTSNLIGNPYPSAIDVVLLVEGNPLSLEGTFYFWTHNTPISGNKYSADDYAVYTNLGGAGTRAALSSGVNNSVPSGKIAAGQSFMAVTKVGAIGPVNFKNTMRLGNAGAILDNSLFFKGAKSKTVAIEKHRVWLNLANTDGAFKQMLVGYITGATNGFDGSFDGVSLDSNKYIDFYSVNDSKNLVIQGRALPFDKTDKVPLGYKTTIEGTFKISIDQADGNLANESVFVEDKVKGVIVDLKKGPYSFSTSIGTFNDRFVLRFIDSVSILNVVDVVNLDKQVIVSVQNHQIKINSFDKIMDKLMIYDLNGRLLYKNEKVNSNEFSVSDFISSKQFLIVKTLLKNGEWVTTETIF